MKWAKNILATGLLLILSLVMLHSVVPHAHQQASHRHETRITAHHLHHGDTHVHEQSSANQEKEEDEVLLNLLDLFFDSYTHSKYSHPYLPPGTRHVSYFWVKSIQTVLSSVEEAMSFSPQGVPINYQSVFPGLRPGLQHAAIHVLRGPPAII